jgi:hypothetical protein
VQWPHGAWSDWKTATANMQYVMDKDAGALQGKAP